MKPVLPISYFGNIAYYWYLAKYKSVLISLNEIYQKQTFRNRCVVLGANGPLNLSVPVERPYGKLTKTKDVLISEAENWRQVHWKTLESCYNRTPYFEFYADDLKALLFSNFKTLAQLNIALTNELVEKIGLINNLQLISDTLHIDAEDKREEFSPKKNSSFKSYPYLQTFTERFGFSNNLSILDLLFNEGPNSICILNESKHEH
ncbi:MAG: WbqC family protein [Crocinitomicaceae bacterium]